jgi:membrane-bound lytic murein transglycosylase A
MARGMKHLLLASLLLLAACAQGERFEAREVRFDELEGWAADDHTKALETFIPSCEVFARKARKRSEGSNLAITESTWRSLCDEANWSRGNPMQAKHFFESRFVPFRVANRGKEEGLFTGYYEPVLYGSFTRHGDFKYPLHAAPPELKTSKPYYTHAEINNGALKGRKLELLWVDDPVMKFFMQIQGSGRVRLENGRELFIGYADGNGHPYVGLGKVMRDRSLLPSDQINFFTIRQWLYENPREAFALMEENPSYIFFKLRDVPAVGAAGVKLTPQRSLAIDSRYIPYGLPLFLTVDLPAQPGQPPVRLSQLMVAQDTGGAIRGPVRGDIFFGPGLEAEYMAGYMKNRGIYTLLVPKEAAGSLREGLLSW